MNVKNYYLEQVMQALIDLLTSEQQAKLESKLQENSGKPVEEPNLWHYNYNPNNGLGRSI